MSRLIPDAAGIGIGISPVAPYLMRAPKRAGLLLGYASMDERSIQEGVERLFGVLVGRKA